MVGVVDLDRRDAAERIRALSLVRRKKRHLVEGARLGGVLLARQIAALERPGGSLDRIPDVEEHEDLPAMLESAARDLEGWGHADSAWAGDPEFVEVTTASQDGVELRAAEGRRCMRC